MQISDKGELKAMVDEVLATNPQAIKVYKAGNECAVGFLVGQMMKKTKGKANPALVNKLIVEAIEKL